MQRPGEDELVAEARQALGPERMNDAFTAGSRLSLAQAVAVSAGRRSVGCGKRLMSPEFTARLEGTSPGTLSDASTLTVCRLRGESR
jgi:hypothetical protein